MSEASSHVERLCERNTLHAVSRLGVEKIWLRKAWVTLGEYAVCLMQLRLLTKAQR